MSARWRLGTDADGATATGPLKPRWNEYLFCDERIVLHLVHFGLSDSKTPDLRRRIVDLLNASEEVAL